MRRTKLIIMLLALHAPHPTYRRPAAAASVARESHNYENYITSAASADLHTPHAVGATQSQRTIITRNMTKYKLSSLVLICYFCVTHAFLHPELSDDFINHINQKQHSWRAGRNFPEDTPIGHIMRLLGSFVDANLEKVDRKLHEAELIAGLPDNFDSREKWPDCPTLNEIRDQGSCGSCWANGAVEAMSDRVCVYSNATRHFHFSAQDLMTCCDTCGLSCIGGQILESWKYWTENGISSGGNFNSSQGCRPYEIPPCEHDVVGKRMPCTTHDPVFPKCVKNCEANYKKSYSTDKMYGKSFYALEKEEGHIRAEVFKNGPLEAHMDIYADFIHYKSGVYEHTTGKKIGGHAIKILGWGVEDTKKYWLVANSWNTDWGDNGFFKIVRGENHCNIETSAVAGEPLLD